MKRKAPAWVCIDRDGEYAALRWIEAGDGAWSGILSDEKSAKAFCRSFNALGPRKAKPVPAWLTWTEPAQRPRRGKK